MQKFSYLSLSILLVFCTSCDLGQETDKNMPKGGWVKGIVFDEDTTSGLDSASINYGHISLDSSNTQIYTDTSGRYSFYSGSNAGIYEVAASKEGYEEAKREIEVIREDTVILDFYLKRRK
jgi:hypothetical protein